MKVLLLLMTVLSVQSINLNGEQKKINGLLGTAMNVGLNPKNKQSSLLELFNHRPDIYSMMLTGEDPERAVILDIGGRLYEAMKNSNKSYIDKATFKKIII